MKIFSRLAKFDNATTFLNLNHSHAIQSRPHLDHLDHLDHLVHLDHLDHLCLKIQLGSQFGRNWMKALDKSIHDVWHRHNCNTYNYTKSVFDICWALSGFYRQSWVLNTLNSNCVY